ncbi:AMP-binding protein [uncultured Jannaschia sp.]|uniref:AMP-binding protein n=1 Tax=uncultured Jannaschia sp. TaxID=293347 RepID=UPI0026197409|nr:AMP-binding protein [uncultured Jannaschia sp.]
MKRLSAPVHALPARNDVAFLGAVFDHLEASRLFAVVRPDVATHPVLTKAVEVDVPAASGAWFDRPLALSHSDEPAQIVFSSGTEGLPKAIVLSRRNLDSTVERLNAAMRVTPEIREYVGVPVAYSFGLGRVRAVAAAGGRSYIPAAFDPIELRHLLAAGEVNAVSVVPSLARVILRAADLFAPVADRVRWIEIGSQFMTGAEKSAMRDLFPRARIVQHYGLTEASRSTFLDISETDPDALDSVGAVDGPVEVRIDATGRICLRGEHVALGRLDPEGRLHPLTDDEGWFVTQDAGAIEGGHLHYRGRLDDQINLGGIKLSAEGLERDIAAALPALEGRFAVVGVPDPMRGHLPLVAIERGTIEAPEVARPVIVAALALRGVTAGDAFRLCEVDALPRTGSGKIRRAALRRDMEAEPTEAGTPSTPSAHAKPRTALEVFRANFPGRTVTDRTRFVDLGGDSLTYLAVALDLERILGGLPENWQEVPAGALEAKAPSPFASLDTPTLIRALAICLVVIGHFGLFDYGGTGAFALFFVAGLNFAMFTIPAVERTGDVGAIFTLLLRIVVLTWLVGLAIWAGTGYGDPLAYTLLGNWIRPDIAGDAWFIDAYVQGLTLLSLPLFSARCRAALAARPFLLTLGAAVAAVGIMVASDRIWDTDHLFRRLPHLLMWMFLCGAAMHFARGLPARLGTAGVFLLGWIAFSGPEIRFVVVAVLAIALLPAVSVPRVLTPVLRHVANASLMIYLTHFQIRGLLEKITGTLPPLVAVVVAVTGGTLLWLLYRPVDAWVRRAIETVGRNVPVRRLRRA